jgi:hypothetical protein
MDNEEKIKRNKEFWNVDKAVKRLVWRLAPNNKGEYSNFKVVEDDFYALKSILGSLDREKNKVLSYAPLFAKLYIYHLTMNIRYYETTVLNEFPHYDLHKLLDKPLHLFFEAFYTDLQNNQLNRLIDCKTEEEKDQVLKDYKYYQKTFTLEYITDKLTKQINEALKTYS